ncbi:hypothetical protein ACFQY0_21445, partial [Haloferula chungangensis]
MSSILSIKVALDALGYDVDKFNNTFDENLEFERIELSREEAIEKFKELGDDLKLELIEDIPEGETLTIYKQGEFFDLCRGI